MLIGMMLALLEKKKEEHPPLRVLFLCRQNSARSQMAAALLRVCSHGQIEAYSAGSQPAAQVHPYAIHLMERAGIDLHHAVPRHLEQFRMQHFDAIITVCDQEHEACPMFPNDPHQIRWTFPDPVCEAFTAEEQYRLFEQTSLQLTFRIRLLITLLERGRS